MTDPHPLRRILLLGDALSRPEGLERALARGGYAVVERDDAEQDPPPAAIPDLLLLTSRRADKRLEAALTTLSGEAWRAIPRVVLLADPDPEGVTRALLLGADDALAAPIHLSELVARLGARLRTQPAPGQERASLWRQELMFDILEELSASIRSDSIVETLVRRVGLATSPAQPMRCSLRSCRNCSAAGSQPTAPNNSVPMPRAVKLRATLAAPPGMKLSR